MLKINFPDGKESDFANLKHFDIIPAGRNEDPSKVDSCIYDGYLTNEKNVYVTVTGGCAYSKSFEVKLLSSEIMIGESKRNFRIETSQFMLTQ